MTVDEAFMLTLSRLPPTLQTLNYSPISAQDRSNADMYYLSLIGKELSATASTDEPMILSTHPRYAHLCELYGEPTVTRVIEHDDGKRGIHPRSVAARLVKMAFYMPSSSQPNSQDTKARNALNVHVKEIPTSFDTYQIKALVSRLFGLPAYGFRLIWETDEWDPVDKDREDWDESSDEDEDEYEDRATLTGKGVEPDTDRFARREIELVDSTRDIGFLFQGQEGQMKIRVEDLT